MPHRKRRLPGALRQGLAHHRHRPARSARPPRAAVCSDLSEQQMRWALGLAATQPVGLREMFGTMTKSFHPGRAAQNGLTAALLAKENFTSSDTVHRGAGRGWAQRPEHIACDYDADHGGSRRAL